MYQKFKTPLYHGTVSEITKIDVTKGRGNIPFFGTQGCRALRASGTRLALTETERR